MKRKSMATKTTAHIPFLRLTLGLLFYGDLALENWGNMGALKHMGYLFVIPIHSDS